MDLDLAGARRLGHEITEEDPVIHQEAIHLVAEDPLYSASSVFRFALSESNTEM
jgi:hypothetical protein